MPPPLCTMLFLWKRNSGLLLKWDRQTAPSTSSNLHSFFLLNFEISRCFTYCLFLVSRFFVYFDRLFSSILSFFFICVLNLFTTYSPSFNFFCFFSSFLLLFYSDAVASVRFIANAAGGLLPVLAENLRSTFRATILTSYGMTEWYVQSDFVRDKETPLMFVEVRRG